MHSIHLQPTTRRVNPYSGFVTPLDHKALKAYKEGWELHISNTLYTSEVWMRKPEGDGAEDFLISQSDQSESERQKSKATMKDFSRIGKKLPPEQVRARVVAPNASVWVFDMEKARHLENEWNEVLQAIELRKAHPRRKSPPNLEKLSDVAKSLLARLLPDDGKPASGVYPFPELLRYIKELDRQDLLSMEQVDQSVELVVRPEFRKLRLPGVPKLLLLVKES